MKLKLMFKDKIMDLEQFNNFKIMAENHGDIEIIETDQIFDLYYQQYEVILYKNNIKVDSFHVYLDLQEMIIY